MDVNECSPICYCSSILTPLLYKYTLRSPLELDLPKGKKTGAQLGVGEENLAGQIKSALGYDCVNNDTVLELIRGLRLHGDKLLRQLKEEDFYRAQLGLGHAYSSTEVKFNVNRSDNMIIQAINLLDQLDKDFNPFSMRVREWYGWHFPALVKIVNDNKGLDERLKIASNFAKMVVADENEEGEVLLAPSTVVATSGNRKSTEDEGEKSKKKKKRKASRPIQMKGSGGKTFRM
ncbi:snoRNP complex protein nop56 [Entophlyctis luteolus]|nr:snoRNP complex protein nop56 [Entophlyctis luteolus]